VAETDSERTEEPTPERRRKAREDGQFPKGKDSGNTVAGVMAMLILAALGQNISEIVGQFAVRCFGEPYDLLRGDPKVLLQAVATSIAAIVLPVAGAASLGGLAIGIAEAGYHPNFDLVAPKWERLNPLPKIQQMFKLQETGVDVLFQLLRVLCVGLVAYNSVKAAFPRLMHLHRVDLHSGVAEVLQAVFRLALWSSMALGVLSLLDYIKSWRAHEQSILMSRQELKEEMKQQEGDPRIKQRVRARAREAARRGIAKAVASADFVIANPTHISVALRYRVSEGAPMVTAKGYDEVALYIRKLAKEHDVPVIVNKPLARALAKRVKAGRPVPVDLYAAVAEILAFVYRLKNRGLETLTGSRAAHAPPRPPAPRPGNARRGPRGQRPGSASS
jgi:flagellar biosynthesis protein FlhB